MKKGFAILEMMILIWAATAIGYGIHRLVAGPPAHDNVQTDNAAR